MSLFSGHLKKIHKYPSKQLIMLFIGILVSKNASHSNSSSESKHMIMKRPYWIYANLTYFPQADLLGRFYCVLVP